MAALNDILNWFKKGLKPTEEQFAQAWSSFRHKDNKVPISDVENLDQQLNDKLGTNHEIDANAHKSLFDLKMAIADYTLNGKIRADKIEALGLTDLIEASENTLAAFVANSGNYEFQKTDFVAIPDVNGNYSLFIFKGGNKSVVGNYLPTGLTKITMAMVEGLQSALDGKMGQPPQNGSFFAKNSNGLTSWQTINAGASYLLFWDGDNFKNSSIFREASGNKFGIGTSAPTEQLHLTGRARMSALVLDDNSENLPNQITKNGNRYYGSNSSAIKRGLMYNDAADLTATMANYSDAEKDAWRLAQRKSSETYSLGQPKVIYCNPPIIKKQAGNQSIVLLGENLYLDTTLNTSSYVKIVHIQTNTAYTIATITVNQLDPRYLSFGFDFENMPLGKYKFDIFNHLTQLHNIDNEFFELVDELEYLDLSSLNWQKLSDPNSDFSDSYAYGNLINVANTYGSGNLKGILGFKSSEIFSLPFLQQNDIIINLTINNNYFSFVDNRFGYTIGLNNSDIPLNLDNIQELVGISNQGGKFSHIPVNSVLYYSWELSKIQHNATIIIRGNLVTFITIVQGNVYIQYTTINIIKGLSIYFYVNSISGNSSTGSLSLNITSIIKLPK